jgi:3-oxoadipate enol-lactonase
MPTLERGDASLHFETVGSGEPLVFIHGRGGNSLLWWQQVDFFAARHRCILIDLRGHGRSRGVSTTTAADQSDVLCVLDALGVGSFSAIGHSLGGVVLGGIAHAFPQRVRAAVFSCSHGGVALSAVDKGRLQASLAEVGRKVRVWKEGSRSHPALGSDFAGAHPSMARLFTWMAGINPSMPVGAPHEASFAPDGFPQHSLFICGEKDEVVPPSVVRNAAASVQGASFVPIPESGHSPYFEQADVFNRIVADFLDGREGRGVPGHDP